MNIFEVYPLYDVTPVKGKDVFIYDNQGRSYLDLYGGHAVISVGHTHPVYVQRMQEQLSQLGFYSNSVRHPLQQELAEKLGRLSGCHEYQLFLCNSGAEANENALKVASFSTGKSRVIAFKNAFHGRTSAAVAATDNPNINAPINRQHQVTFLNLGDHKGVATELQKGDVCAVIIECIQGVGGLDESTSGFYEKLYALCKAHEVFFIADEIQSGYGRTGDFFAFQKYPVTPDIITIAKGMGNGFPIGGILLQPHIKARYGMLGTTFGGNHLACTAGIAVLDILEQEQLLQNVQEMSAYFQTKANTIPQVKKVKGRGLMLGLEFDMEIAELRKKLIYKHRIFTGSAKNKKVLRILPPLTLQKQHLDLFFNALNQLLS